MYIDFTTAVDKLGMYVSTSIGKSASLSIFNGASLLETVTLSLPTTIGGGSGHEGFIALSNLNITRADISSTNSSGNWNFVIDDLKLPTSVPEPATLALMGLGLAGLGFARRKNAA